MYIEFAFLCTGVELDPLTVRMPGFTRMNPQEGPLLTVLKVVFERGDCPEAPIEVKVRDATTSPVGHYSGVFTPEGIIPTAADVPPPPVDKEQAHVHGVLITDSFDFTRPGLYKVSWYIAGILKCSSMIEIYLP